MWKPRCASFALCALSLFFIWKLFAIETESIDENLIILFTVFSGVGVFCGFSGIIASFLATSSGDEYFVPSGNFLVRFLVKEGIVDLSRNMGFCVYSIGIGAAVIFGIFCLFLMGVIGYLLFAAPMALLSSLLILIGCVVGVCVLVLLAMNFPKIVLALIFLGFLYLCSQMYTADKVEIVDALVAFATFAGIVGALLYMRHLLTKTRIYAQFCPHYSKTESTSSLGFSE